MVEAEAGLDGFGGDVDWRGSLEHTGGQAWGGPRLLPLPPLSLDKALMGLEGRAL